MLKSQKCNIKNTKQNRSHTQKDVYGIVFNSIFERQVIKMKGNGGIKNSFKLKSSNSKNISRNFSRSVVPGVGSVQ